jgi:hypothetical protein
MADQQYQQELLVTQSLVEMVSTIRMNLDIIPVNIPQNDYLLNECGSESERRTQKLLALVKLFPNIELDTIETVFVAQRHELLDAVDVLAEMGADIPHREEYTSPYAAMPTASKHHSEQDIGIPRNVSSAPNMLLVIDHKDGPTESLHHADTKSTPSSTLSVLDTPSSTTNTLEHPAINQNLSHASTNLQIIDRMAVAFPKLPRKVIETALKESNWDPDAGAVKIIEIMEAFAIQAAHQVADAEFEYDSESDQYAEADETENENPDDSYSESASDSDTDSNFSDFNDDMGVDAAQLVTVSQPAANKTVIINLDIAENIVSFAEDKEDEISDGQSRGQNWTFAVIGYPEPVAVQSLEQIPAFEKCFEQDPAKFEAKAPLSLSSHIPPDIFRMILQWADHEVIILDEKRDDRLDVLIRLVHAATSLGMTVENDKAIISSMIKDILSTEHEKNYYILNTSHVVTFFSTLKHVASLDPTRDLLAKAVTREFLAHRDDTHARGDDPVYDADAGPARRGLQGRQFRWNYELERFPELQNMLDRIINKTLRTREVVEKSTKKSRPAGIYLADPLTGESRLWM